jgi:hypothetical protein
MTTPSSFRVMSPGLAQLTPQQFHAQGLRWERTRQRILLAWGNTDKAMEADYHARKHERQLDLL